MVATAVRALRANRIAFAALFLNVEPAGLVPLLRNRHPVSP
jgi:hypothetical protein